MPQERNPSINTTSISGDSVGGDKAEGDIVAGDKIVHLGPSAMEVLQIAQYVFDSNFYRLADEAQKEAKRRADEILIEYLQCLSAESPEHIVSAHDPDMQYVLFEAQKAYARSGDKNLRDILVDLLIGRSKQPKRSTLQLTLNEAIETVSKLSGEHFNTLAILLMVRFYWLDIGDMGSFGKYIHNRIVPIALLLSTNPMHYLYLSYTGCATNQGVGYDLAITWKHDYHHIFRKKVTKKVIDEYISYELVSDLFDNYRDDVYIVKSESDDDFREKMKVRFDKWIEQYDESDKPWADYGEKLGRRLDETFFVSPREVEEIVKNIAPETKQLFTLWSRYIRLFQLTTVGIAIAHAYISTVFNDVPSLETFIND